MSVASGSPSCEVPVELTADLFSELEWFTSVLKARLDDFFGIEDAAAEDFTTTGPPTHNSHRSAFAAMLADCECTASERVIVMLAVAPWLCPFILDPLLVKSPESQRGYTEFGGVAGVAHGGFLPTGETGVFLLGGTDLGMRRQAMALLSPASNLVRRGLIVLQSTACPEPQLSGILQPGPRLRAVLFPEFCQSETKAGSAPLLQPLTSELSWNDLVLPSATMGLLDEICDWHRHQATLLTDWGLRGRVRSGSVNLFFGVSGTGKSLAAALLGKRCGCPVLRLDLSTVISKYVGETEKNLSQALSMAEAEGAVLVCDEADCMFGKRGKQESAQDRFANQEVSYLLQRVEEFSGIIILTSNLRMNIDDAFQRRFHLVVDFPMPQAAERLRLWRASFGTRLRCHPDLSLEKIAEKYELTGGSIVNVVRLAALRAAVRGDAQVLTHDVLEGIRREYRKEGRPI